MAHSIRTNVPLVDVPGYGRVDNAGVTLVLDDETFSMIPSTAFGGTNPPLTDLGFVGVSAGAVSAQATHVSANPALTSTAPAALTSGQSVAPIAVTPANAAYTVADQTTVATLANDLRTRYNQAQVDIAALRTTLAATQTDLATLQTTVNALLAALAGPGKPMA